MSDQDSKEKSSSDDAHVGWLTCQVSGINDEVTIKAFASILNLGVSLKTLSDDIWIQCDSHDGGVRQAKPNTIGLACNPPGFRNVGPFIDLEI